MYGDRKNMNESRKINSIHAPVLRLRKWAYLFVVASSSLTGVLMMSDILGANGLTWLELLLLVLFSITFSWIVASFWNAVVGFVLMASRRDPLSLRRQANAPEPALRIAQRFAVLMPVYNEDTSRVMAGFEANLQSLIATGALEYFDFYLLSDTQDPEIVKAEASQWQAFFSRQNDDVKPHVFYRRRSQNTHRKVGNLSDFCTRWGSRYEGMIVLDADSLMSGECMLSLARGLQDNPRAGLLQTIPVPVRQETFFGRFLQFAAEMYSPMLATGQSFWQGNGANYWGHNAIIRVKAFMDHCALPVLPGREPFGGEILSHDFVEAAMLARADWDVYLLNDLRGSYEEVPSNIPDFVTRDRRWVQGNLQHLALLPVRGWRVVSRVHFLSGALAYITSPLWLLMLVFSSIDAVYRAVSPAPYFSQSHQLFPDWPIAKPELIFSLLTLTAVMLLLPKFASVLLASIQQRRAFGGVLRMWGSALLETLFAIVIAPVMMVFHSYFVVMVLLGKKARWDAQPREGRMVSWADAFKRTAAVSFLALLWGALTAITAPLFFYWLLPVLVGLVLAAPLVRYSSSLALGRKLRAWGLFLAPTEIDEPEVMTLCARLLREERGANTVVPFTPVEHVPPAEPRPMSPQNFDYPKVVSQLML